MNSNLILLKNIKIRLKSEFGEKIKDIVLYGSQINGKASEFSDFNILIVLNIELSWQEKDKIRNCCYDFALENDLIIDTKIISQPELESGIRGKLPLIKDALSSGIYAC